MGAGTELLTDRHHLFYKRRMYRDRGLRQQFRELQCHIVLLWLPGHRAIHGHQTAWGLQPGLYIPPRMPTQGEMRQLVDRHLVSDFGRTWYTGPCEHEVELVTASLFALSDAPLMYAGEPVEIEPDLPCATITLDAQVRRLVGQCYRPNEQANPWQHLDYLRKLHDRGRCRCGYDQGARTVRKVTREPVLAGSRR